MEPFGASGTEVREAKPLKEMVGTRRLELLTSTVSNLSQQPKTLCLSCFSGLRRLKKALKRPSFGDELVTSLRLGGRGQAVRCGI